MSGAAAAAVAAAAAAATAGAAAASTGGRGASKSMLWLRKGLRLHDNPALHAACRGASHLYPVFVLDPWFLRPDPAAPSPGSTRVGINRIRFLLEALADLDASLRARGSRLLLLEGDPAVVVPRLCQSWGITRLCFEFDTEPYAQARDAAVQEAAGRASVEVVCPVSHTLFDPRETIQRNKGKAPMTYQSFLKLLGAPHAPAPDPPAMLPPLGPEAEPPPGPGAQPHASGEESKASKSGAPEVRILPGVPSLVDLGYTRGAEGDGPEEEVQDGEMPPFRGGETEGLRRLGEMMQRRQWVADFEKPKGDPSAFLAPATTVLSPYLKFGCVSARLMYARVREVYAQQRKHTMPPVSLEGQLLWREFFYTASFGTPNFDRMEGNAACRQVAWTRDPELLRRWRDAQTGFPWIDAIMMQLRKWGWMHHLARHSVACFLTRGDLYVHWEEGRDVFDRLLLDSDWAINNGNWLWLSASAFFSQYHRIYSPISFGKKYDPTGKFIREFLPVLKDMPAQYIYEPWTAPLPVQKKAQCIIGKDYPHPVVDHAEASKLCKERMAIAYGSPSARSASAAADAKDAHPHSAKKSAGTGKRRQAPRAGAKAVGGEGDGEEEEDGGEEEEEEEEEEERGARAGARKTTQARAKKTLPQSKGVSNKRQRTLKEFKK